MLLKVCPLCKGDRKPIGETEENIARAMMIYPDGTRFPAMSEGPEDPPPAGKPMAYEFSCLRCNGTGELTWRRGMSLTPECKKPAAA